jgi:hypothetical protein
MIEQLKNVIKSDLEKWVSDIRGWDSLIINKRQPHTTRVFRMLPDGSRLCLHKFDYINKDGGEEAFMHPHPWPAAFQIVMGTYEMKVGATPNILHSSPEHILTTRLSHGSSYEITNPNTWHSVTPITKTVHTVMLNGAPWKPGDVHTAVRTTKGKDFLKLEREALANHLSFFNHWLYNAHVWYCGASPTGFCESSWGGIDAHEHEDEDENCIYCHDPMDERK